MARGMARGSRVYFLFIWPDGLRGWCQRVSRQSVIVIPCGWPGYPVVVRGVYVHVCVHSSPRRQPALTHLSPDTQLTLF